MLAFLVDVIDRAARLTYGVYGFIPVVTAGITWIHEHGQAALRFETFRREWTTLRKPVQVGLLTLAIVIGVNVARAILQRDAEAQTTIHDLRAENSRLRGPALIVGERDSQEWTDLQGRRYPQGGFTLGPLLSLAVTVGQPQRFNPCVQAPDAESLENVLLHLTFASGLTVQRNGSWTPQGGTQDGATVYSESLGHITRGECVNGGEAIFFAATKAAPFIIGYSVTTDSLPPGQGQFSFIAKQPAQH